MGSVAAPKMYLAGPLGFTEAGRRYHEGVMLPAVRAAGLEPLDPWELTDEIRAVFDLARDHPERRERLLDANRTLGRRNAEMIRAAGAVLAVLDGPDVDSGTAAEIGYASALGRPVVGLRTDVRTAGDNEVALVNLQVEWFILDSGGGVVSALDEAVDALVELVARPAR